jgi:exopolyphosphatase/guanosine-5'-triphosphate,3'-diphosphate pyrophosphatase
VRLACIDIGSNTTRLLVADCEGGRLRVVAERRAFTHIARDLVDGAITGAKLDEVSREVAAQLGIARELGAAAVHGVATAAIRRAANGSALVAAIRDSRGLSVKVLSGEEEAHLAFLGAARTLGHLPAGPLGVVDVGGGSCELVVGTAPDKVTWSASIGVGSGELAATCLHSDPPSADELGAARRRVARAVGGLEVPHAAEALAVGGTATSLRRFAGPRLDAEALGRSLALLAAASAADLARRFSLDVQRVRLLPAGLLILQAASELFGATLEIARGGVREGVLLEASLADSENPAAQR